MLSGWRLAGRALNLDFGNAVLQVHEDDVERMASHQGRIDIPFRDNIRFVTRLEMTGGGTIQADDAAAAGARNSVRLPKSTCRLIGNLNHLKRDNACGIEEVFIDGDGSHVVQISLGDRDGMKFGNGHADGADRGGDGGG